MVGQSLGNRDNVANEINVLVEQNETSVNFTTCLPIAVYSENFLRYPYAKMLPTDNLVVPYSVIKPAKKARANGTREVFIFAGDRPDRNPRVRSNLDLWGFSSYIEFVYTICELCFLEGLIPVVDPGFLGPRELKRLSEIISLLRIQIDDPQNPYGHNDFQKNIDIKKKLLEWAMKINIPVSTGVVLGKGQPNSFHKQSFEYIQSLHDEYGLIHEVVIEPYNADVYKIEGTKSESTKTIKAIVKMAREILSDDILITTPFESVNDFGLLEEIGITDLGRISVVNFNGYNYNEQFEKAVEFYESSGRLLNQRFALKKEFIKTGKYSKKLGQVFDSYKYLIKKEGQDK